MNDGSTKPEIAVVRMKSGRVKIVGECAAARWLGMRQQELDRIIRKQLFPPPRVASYQAKVNKVLAAYPEIFKQEA